MGIEVPGEEDDNKRRRNLVSFAVLVCVAYFFDVDLNKVLDKVAPGVATIPAWKPFVAGLSIDAYLVFRYVVRDASRGRPGQLVWLDRLDTADAFRTVFRLRLENTARRLVLALEPRWSAKSFRLGLLKDNAIEKLVQEAHEDPLIRGKSFKFEFGGYGETVDEANPDKSTVGVAITVPMPSNVNNKHAHQIVAGYNTRSWTFWRIWLHSWIQVLFASRIAIDVLLPYYLAAAAAVVLTLKFAAS